MTCCPKVRYSGVLNQTGRRLLRVCFEPLDEFLGELSKETPLETRVQVPEENAVYFEPYPTDSILDDG